MKSISIIAAALSVLVGFLSLVAASKDREQQARLDQVNANFEASRQKLICEHHKATRPDDPNVQAACNLVDAVAPNR